MADGWCFVLGVAALMLVGLALHMIDLWALDAYRVFLVICHMCSSLNYLTVFRLLVTALCDVNGAISMGNWF